MKSLYLYGIRIYLGSHSYIYCNKRQKVSERKLILIVKILLISVSQMSVPALAEGRGAFPEFYLKHLMKDKSVV
jgi:hypothetical protein